MSNQKPYVLVELEVREEALHVLPVEARLPVHVDVVVSQILVGHDLAPAHQLCALQVAVLREGDEAALVERELVGDVEAGLVAAQLLEMRQDFLLVQVLEVRKG
jgi:hypothetical protein